MNPKAATTLALFALLSLTGCDKNPLGTIESQGHPPFVKNVTVTPAAVSIDTLPQQNGISTLSGTLRASVEDADGYANIHAVEGEIVGPSGDVIQTLTLHDDGSSPDAVRGDGIYAARMSLPVSRTMIGRFYPFVSATDASGLKSNSVSSSLTLFVTLNSPPRIFNLSAPDTVQVSLGQTARIPMSVEVADSNGLADVREVFFRSLDSSDPNAHFQLLDDGGQGGSVSGDSDPGDGVYSIVVQLTVSSTTKPRYRFLFQARDAAGDTSASILHTLTFTGL